MRIRFYLLFLLFMPSGIIGAQETEFTNHHRSGDSYAPLNPMLEPFYHGVASGDPQTDGVVLWTRLTPDQSGIFAVDWEIASDTGFTNVLQNGTFDTDEYRDYTVKVEVNGLNPGTTYYYRFQEGSRYSITGRTKTLPVGTPDQLKFAVVSCNNYQSGYFNAFGRIAERNDIDAVIHLGDFIYEYQEGGFGFDPGIGRGHEPENEILDLADYRIRYSFYRLDDDLRRAMQQHPFIHIWDDHEVANDAWRDGAQNHDPITEGDYHIRKSDATRVFYEWVPIRETQDSLIYRSLEFGDLAELILLDTRHESRSMQVFDVNDPTIADPSRKLLGDIQYNWFTQELASSTQNWKIIGNQVLFSHLLLEAFEPLFPGVSNNFLDIWQGYPARRDTVLNFLELANIQNAVFITGDIHVSMAYDVSKAPGDPTVYDPVTGDGALAVEFVTPSITSNNFDEAVGLTAAELFQSIFPGPNPHAEFVDFVNHGYFILDITDSLVQADYYFVPTVRNPDNSESFECGIYTFSGDNFLQKTTSPSAPKPVQEIPAPDPTLLMTNTLAANNNLVILGVYPNPGRKKITINYGLDRTEKVKLELLAMSGVSLHQFFLFLEQSPGNYQIDLEWPDFPAGVYVLKLTTPTQNLSRIVQKL